MAKFGGGALVAETEAPVSVWSAQRDHVGHDVIDVLLWYLEIHFVWIILVDFHPLCQGRCGQVLRVGNFGKTWCVRQR